MSKELVPPSRAIEVLDGLGLPDDVAAAALQAIQARLDRQPSDLQDPLPEAPEEAEPVFREDIWSSLKALAEQHSLPAGSQSIADAETLVASQHPKGDAGVVAAIEQAYGKWSAERKQAARALAGLYRTAIDHDAYMPVVAPIHAFGEEAEDTTEEHKDTEPPAIEVPRRLIMTLSLWRASLARNP